MKTETKADPYIVIRLSYEEAELLQAMVQNSRCHPVHESTAEHELRAALFDALRAFTEAHE
jgi:hypothetical protein